MDQLGGIGGGRSLGFGANRIRSLPDGIAKLLDEYLYIRHWENEVHEDIEDHAPTLPLSGLDDPKSSRRGSVEELCPECGMASLVNEEGCRKCYSCGYSEC